MPSHLRVIRRLDTPEAEAGEPTTAIRLVAVLRRAGLPSLVAASVFLLCFENGTFGSTTRGAFAIAVWWALVLTAAIGLGTLSMLPPAALAAGGGLAGLAALSGISMLWAPSAEKAFIVLGLDSLYLGVFLLVSLAVSRASLRSWCDGLALGMTAVIGLALLSRLFPGHVPTSAFRFLPVAQTRLSYPLGYWNGLGVLAALLVPLLLRTAVTARLVVIRAAAVGFFPALIGVLYLTSSRGGTLAAILAALVFVGLVPTRLLAVTALAAGTIGGAAFVAALHHRDHLVNGPFDATATAEGHSAFFVLLLASILTTAGYALVSLPLRRAFTVRTERVAFAGMLVLVFVAVAAADPVARIHAFKQPLAASQTSSDYVAEHLLSGSGNGRWELWTSAAKEFRANPVLGGGAGSFQSWWEQHRPVALFVENAHSLYLETLGELGLVGFAFVALFVLVGLRTGVRRALSNQTGERVLSAALVAAFAAFCFGAAVDWIWQIPALTAVGIALLALVTSAGAAQERWRRTALRTPVVARVALVLAGMAAVGVQALPLFVSLQLSDSQAAAARGNGTKAVKAAAAARDLEPWAASPYLQLALVEEAGRQYGAARADIERATARDASDWRLWSVAARIEAKAGAYPAAARSVTRACELNPFSAGAQGLCG